MKKLKKVIIGIICCTLILVVGFLFYAADCYKPSSEALNVINDNSDNVDVIEKDGLITFQPKNMKCDKGFIFYPGGKVEPESYSKLCRNIAEEGYLVVITKMPFNLAVFDEDIADKAIKEYNYINKWAIGGHSLGGVMASEYAEDNNEIKGLVLLASYPLGNDLRNENLKTLSIYGSNDKVADESKVVNSVLSNDSEIKKIEGGNHAQFGEYGEQDGDGKASISNEKQIDITTSLIVQLMREI